MAAIVYELFVAPAMLTEFFCHWYVGAGVPLAAAVNVIDAPAVTVWLAGWVVIAGATATTAVFSEITVAEYEANEAPNVEPLMLMLPVAMSVKPLPPGLAASSCGLP